MITLLKIKLSAKRYNCYIPDSDELNWQNVYANYFLFGKFLFYRKVIFSEIVPMYAVISYQTLGFTSWLSEKPLLISAASKKRTIYVKKILNEKRK